MGTIIWIIMALAGVVLTVYIAMRLIRVWVGISLFAAALGCKKKWWML